MNSLSLAALTILPASPVEQIEAAAEAGFQSVGLRIKPVSKTDMEVIGDFALRGAIKQALARTGITVLDIEAFPFGGRTELDSFIPYLEFGAEIGAQFLVCGPGTRDETQAADQLAKLAELATAYRIKPVLEFVSYRLMRTIEDAYRLLARAAHPNIGICVDVLHLHRSGGDADALGKYDPGLFPYIQICDAVLPPPPADQLQEESRHDRRYPGEGDLPLMDVLNALPTGIPFSVEAPSAADAHLFVAQKARKAFESTRKWLVRRQR